MVIIKQAAPSANVTAATGGVFQVAAGQPGAGTQNNLGLPGTNVLNADAFVVRVSGVIQAAAGTYTATVQPLLYASTTAGFTAAASQAIFSAAAVTLAQTTTAASAIPYELEAHCIADSTSGLFIGWSQGQLPTTSSGTSFTSATASPTILVAANVPTKVNMSTEPPVQFAFGITVAGTLSATPVLSLLNFLIEA